MADTFDFSPPPWEPPAPAKKMEWSPQQAAGLKKAHDWIKSKDKSRPVFRIGGWAGTGKSTLADALAAGVDGPVYYAAPTGKAAHILRRKTGSQNVGTIHSFIYRPQQRSETKLIKLKSELAKERSTSPKNERMILELEKEVKMEEENLTRPFFQLNTDSPLQQAALLILDEYSMVDAQMGEDLLRFGCPILALGDPGQLPPPKAKPFWTTPPDVLLTEIHRQAKDNPIIRLSMEVREGRALKPGYYGESSVVGYGELKKDRLREIIQQADQLLVGRNDTRRSSNLRMRQLNGFSSPYPEAGDKLVCLRNNLESNVFNGQLWTATSKAAYDPDGESVEFMASNPDDGREGMFTAHSHYFRGGEPQWFEVRERDCFDYGYALTVHKFQGSQAPNIVLLDEWFSNHRREWLYTGITRAEERITIVQM